MTVNDGNGLYDKYGLIDSIICDLDKVQVQGAQNMVIIVNSIQKLSALRKALKEEDDANNNDDKRDV